MPYFQQGYLDFFSELEENNHRDWFHANKKRYETFVKVPFKRLVQDLIEGVNELGEDVQIEAKDAIFRINRDIRFSKDKSPYKLHMSALISAGGKKSMDHPGLYLEQNAKEARVYSGAYQLDKESLHRMRTHIAQNQERFHELLNESKFVKHFGEIQGEKNKRIPKEFVEVGEQQPLIYNKQFYYYASFPASEILTENWKETILTYYQIARPMGEFILEAIKD